MKKLVALCLISGIVFSNGMNVSAAGLKDVFNAKYYAEQYKDLYDAFGYDEELLYQHFLTYGINEGRVMNPVIDIVKYRNSYEDLNTAFGDNWDSYVQHYIDYGIKEKRDNGTDFDPIAYVESYSDIEEAFGNDFTAIIEHYQNFGVKEDRKESSRVYQEEVKKQKEAASKPPVIVPPEDEDIEYPVMKDENGNIYDLGGMEIVIRNWWSSGEVPAPVNEYEQAKQDYLEWAQDTYNFTIKELAISDWGSTPQDFVDYVTSGGDDNNYIFTLRNDPVTIYAMDNGYMYDLSTFDFLNFADTKFQSNKLHQQYSKDGKINAMYAGYAEPRGGIFFNKRLLQEAGIDPNSIYDMQANGTWTWEAWEEMMKTVQRDVDNDGTIDIYGFDANYGNPVCYSVYSNDSNFVGMENGDYTYEFENPKTVEALKWIAEMIDVYACERPEDALWDYYKTAFVEGKCAFMPDESFNGSSYYFIAEMDDEVGFVMFPKGPKATDYVNCWSSNAHVIPSCYDEEKAWKLAFAYDIYTDDVPGFEDYFDYSMYSSYALDARSKNETLKMMTQKGMITYHDMIAGLDMGKPFLWNFGGYSIDVDEVLASVRDTYKAAINEANQ